MNYLNKLTKNCFLNSSSSSTDFFCSLPRGAESADLWFLSQIFTYGRGLKSSTGGPLMEINIKSDTFSIVKRVLRSVMVRFISEKPRSHSEVMVGSMFSVFIRSEDALRERKLTKLSNSDKPNLRDTLLTSSSPLLSSVSILNTSSITYRINKMQLRCFAYSYY